MIRLRSVWALLAATLFACSAGAQAPDTEFGMDIQLNFGGDYPRDAWIPVDVLVSNNVADYEGYVEVRAYRGNDLLSPIYQVPASSPRNSSKRFRLYGRFGDADRVETNFFHQGRAVLSVNPYLGIRPTNPDDRYALLLTEAPEDYGFLNLTLPEKISGEPARLYRKRLDTTMLSLLPEHAACYGHYDLIVIDDVESGRIGPDAQELIEEYVKLGGALVVMTGARANVHANGWLEDLAGVSIGPQQPVDESIFAGAFEDPSGISADRQVAMAILEPNAPDVRVIRSGDVVLSTLRPLGQGVVVTFAIDAELRGLQDAPGYRALWRDLFAHQHTAFQPDTANAANWLLQNLPAIAGVTFFSKGAVLTYLLLYIGVAIVGNWLVCNFIFRRREWAWGFLVLFSFGFTTYALVFGTAGRAQSSEASRISIVRLDKDAAIGDYASLYSLLTSRTQTYALDLEDPQTLVADQAQYDIMTNERGVYNATPSQPFRFRLGPEPGVEDLRIGASELRLLRTEGVASFDGAITGTLEGYPGAMTGELRNETGHAIRRATLLMGGERFECAVEEDLIRPMFKPIVDRNNAWNQYNFAPGTKPDIDAGVEWAIINAAGGRPATETPVLLAWIDTHPIPAVTVREDEVPLKHDLALIVAEVDWRPSDADGFLRIPMYQFEGAANRPLKRPPDPRVPFADSAERYNLESRSEIRVSVLLPEDFEKREGGEIRIEAAAEPSELNETISIYRLRRGGAPAVSLARTAPDNRADSSFFTVIDRDWRENFGDERDTRQANDGLNASDLTALLGGEREGNIRNYRFVVPAALEGATLSLRIFGIASASEDAIDDKEFAAWH